MSPSKHGNSAQLDCKMNVLIFCVPASQAEVYINIATEFQCLLGLTVTYVYSVQLKICSVNLHRLSKKR